MSKKNEYTTRTERVKKRKLKLRYKILLPILIIALAIGGYAFYLNYTANKAITSAHEGLDRERSSLRDNDVNPIDDNVSVLLMGIDSSDTRGGDEIARTDALLVATFNVEDKSIKLLSIPRDSLVYIPFIGKEDKINHAHAFAHKDGKGPTATVETVESLLEIPIDYYVRMNFEAFIGIVDALDGINIDVPYEFKEQDSNDKANAIHLYPGMQMLDGEEALALARTRKLDSDFERGKRQQEILKAIFTRSLSVRSILKYDDVIKVVGENMKTNMSPSEMKSFLSYVTTNKGIDIENVNIAGDDLYLYNPNRTYYWDLDDQSVAETSNLLQRHLEIDETDYGYDTPETNDETYE